MDIYIDFNNHYFFIDYYFYTNLVFMNYLNES